MRSTERKALWLALLPLLTPAASWGVGLGEITMRSHLNEPLNAEVALMDLQGLASEDIRIRLATQEDFDRMGVERAYFLTNIEFDVSVDGAGRGVIRLTTNKPLLEPYLDFILETRWPSGRLLREYTVLVDLPPQSQTKLMAGSAAAAESAEPEVQVEVSPAPVEKKKPKRQYDANTQPVPAPGDRYLVEANDSLWRIAAAARPKSATVEQTMLATLEMNPQAFNGGNINGLKAGYVLYLPEDRDITNTHEDALVEVAQQNYEWREGIRREPALRVVADEDFGNDEPLDSDEIGASGDGLEIDDSETSVLEESPVLAVDDTPVGDAVDSDVVGGMSGGADKSAQDTEQSADLQRIQSQLMALSTQIESLREQVQIKDEKIATLQAQLAAQQQQPASVVTPVMSTSVGDSAADSGEFPWWAYAFGGVVVLGAAGFVLWRRQQGKEQAATTVSVPANTMASKKESAPVKQGSDEAAKPRTVEEEIADDGSERGYGKKLLNEYADHSGTSDAIAEADIYVAYGRPQQALDILKQAAEAEGTDRARCLLRMMQIYVSNDRMEEAEGLLGDIEQTHDTQALKEALSLLPKPPSSQDKKVIGGDDPLGLVDDTPQAHVNIPQEVNTPNAPTGGADLSDLSSLDFDMVPSPAESKEVLEMDLEPAPAENPLLSRINMSSDTAEASEDQPEGQAEREPSDLEPLPMEFELSSPDDPAFGAGDQGETEEIEAVPLPEMEELSSPEMSLSWDLDSGDDEEETESTSGKLPPELAAVLGTDVPPPMMDADIDDEDNELIYATEADPFDSKLDLARAYLDMGDEDGAKPLLEEIIGKGDLAQQAEARQLLDRIG